MLTIPFMDQIWSSYEGLSACGWKLQSFLGPRDGRGFFVAQDPAGWNALVQIIPKDDDAEAVCEGWRHAAKLSSEHLISVYETGETELSGHVPVYFAAMELPDDDIGELSTRRSLTADELRSVNAAATGALEYLHANGLVHGAVEPSSIFVVNGQYKLSVDTLADASPGKAEADIRSLGGMIRTLPADDRIDSAPETESAASIPPGIGSGRQRWFIAAACAIGILVLIAILLARPTKPQPRTQPESVASVRVPPAPRPPRADPFERVTPAHATPARSVTTDTADRSVDPPDRRRWSVVAATYATYTGAEKRSEAMRERWPGLEPGVFPENGEGNLYFVVLGTKQSKDGAAELRRKALSQGAAGDVYITMLLKR